MPFQMKIQPVHASGAMAFLPRSDPVKPVAKSRLKRLIERQFPSVLRSSSAEKTAGFGERREKEREDGGDIEPSSVCLDRMVIGFIEGGYHEKQPRGRCNCFNANFDDSSDDDFDARDSDAPGCAAAPSDVAEAIKSLVLCASVVERNLLADASKILEKAKNSKNKGECRRMVSDGLRSLGYDAAICKSRWDKDPSFPAGEYEYIDVVMDGGDRFLVDVDYRSEFEVARPTKSFRAVLQHLPQVFVGRSDRLQQIVAFASEAARQSLKKKGLHVPPWRRPEYMKAKWLSPYQRTADREAKEESASGGEVIPCLISSVYFSGVSEDCGAGEVADDRTKGVVSPWRPPPARPQAGVKVVTGLALVL
ncbi:uncharacterized protein LOC135584582 [Musa acuminata AAA Group]|uniref:(wild Malaysian banana) hypothetical protein n=1 Tax=Musa acuminata subsp. malaccensis TaxID=214687 RepID=A0A804K8S6_MUSAM|nr:PREDICTED: uncharacterized protein LOC103995119 [Musa acuminata subsp. malaccensis]XP_009413914.1 PREDICTED: uncharacterized protein LOC103995119 [Musa acuminata subsp. malaccensis]CAG1832202.1 unnamed protein product [Musa acuminata subsp. malaccensis]